MHSEDILATYSFNSLRTIARVHGLALGTLRRPELITTLAAQVFTSEAVARAWAAISASERTTLQLVVRHGGRITSADLAQALLHAGLIDSAGPVRARETIDRIPPTTRRFDELCARLTAHALLFSEPSQAGTLSGPHDLAPADVVFVPGIVFERVREAASETTTVEQQPAAQEPAMPQVQGRLLVQPTYTVLVLPPLDESTLERLRTFAEPLAVAEVAEFKLTQAALFAAVERGASVREISAFLEERSGLPLPQNVQYTLNAWNQAFEQVRVYQSAAVLDGSPELLDHVQRTAELAPFVLRRLSPERLLLKHAAAAARALGALDELPEIIDYAVAQRQRFTVTDSGVIHPTVPDLLLTLELRRVAEPRANGDFQLAPERVRAAVAQTPDGLTGLLKWLRDNSGPLPPQLGSRIRAWALPHDAVALEQPLLLRLPLDLLLELRAEPELAPLLSDEYRPTAALVRVPPENHAALVAALQARGLLSETEHETPGDHTAS